MQKFNLVLIQPDNYLPTAAFHELAETIIYGLRRLNYPTSYSTNYFSTEAINIILGAHLIPENLVCDIPKNSIIYNTEQLSYPPSPIAIPLLPIIVQFQAWDYSKSNIKFLSQLAMAHPPQYVPIGFVPKLCRIPAAPLQDIDVLFYGYLNPRRAQILQALAARNLQVYHAIDCYGQERDALIARAKVVLNVHYYESKIFEIVRVSYLSANRKAVVSEVDVDTDIDPMYQQAIVGVPYNELVETCYQLVHDPVRRKQQEETGFTTMSAITAEDCMRPAVDAILNKIK